MTMPRSAFRVCCAPFRPGSISMSLGTAASVRTPWRSWRIGRTRSSTALLGRASDRRPRLSPAQVRLPMVRLGRTGTLAVISALSEIADAIETLDKASCHSPEPGFTDTDTLDTLYEEIGRASCRERV